MNTHKTTEFKTGLYNKRHDGGGNLGKYKQADENLFDPQEEVNVWEIQRGEPSVAFSSFVVFRDLGPTRTLAKTRAILKRKETIINQYSADYKWFARALVYDKHLDKIRQDLKIKEIEEMHKRHAHHAMTLENTIMVPVKIFIERVHSGDFGDLKDMPMSKLTWVVQQAASMFSKIQASERLARGVAADISQIDHTTNNQSINLDYDNFKGKLMTALSESSPEVKEKILSTLDSYQV